MRHIIIYCMCSILQDDQPRAPALHSSPRSTRSMDSPRSHSKPEPGFTLAATFTANNRWAATPLLFSVGE